MEIPSIQDQYSKLEVLQVSQAVASPARETHPSTVVDPTDSMCIKTRISGLRAQVPQQSQLVAPVLPHQVLA